MSENEPMERSEETKKDDAEIQRQRDLESEMPPVPIHPNKGIVGSLGMTSAIVVLCMACMGIAASIDGLPPAFKFLPLVVANTVLAAYLINRLLAAQQKLVSWQILIAGFWLGVITQSMVMLMIMYVMSQQSSG